MTSLKAGPAPGAPAPRSEFARAKVNLALHVVGQRADGYHLLDSIVAFPAIGDRLSLMEGAGLAMSVAGPFASQLADLDPKDNLVLRAAALTLEHAGLDPEGAGLHLRLEKSLPVASGIGGGSADAAAAIRLVCDHLGIEPDDGLRAKALKLGADVPMCLAMRPLRARGIGDDLVPLAHLPDAGILLVNPVVPVATPAIFRRLSEKSNPPIEASDGWDSYAQMIDMLCLMRNDLEGPAIALAPAIAEVLGALRGFPDCALARMSGSGATCFGLFETAGRAEAAAGDLRRLFPHWWVAAAALT
ncbi:4-diphosphocytidyl-2-C-methyl-D-erythritol kinase [Hartmannibacter diazotrophicus]|uniref:4-diphosphocytidyl-2-C-methyl-D-erythritol kinase n=1 Tax=Hartmannibacter diazotrophicus TaxID=1482074 RepID=A0A2C9D370_9HYPH|nr:4-(cytidine 5'-diphospho)-2-C-methyl-D-erythritol kinase [Hartmannibacter diazotrophicus]SON54710.1 4-diphosphocytidyl-2-C-methyl-D-erythritol kinase [Hartmannibacter diazotrophicus]